MLRQVLAMGCLGLALSFFGCQSSATSSSPTPEPSKSATELSGKALFEANCAGCHGMTGHGNQMMLQGKQVRFDDPAFQKILTDAQIKQTVKNGRGLMPSFGTTFTEPQLNQLVTYLRSLAHPKS